MTGWSKPPQFNSTLGDFVSLIGNIFELKVTLVGFVRGSVTNDILSWPIYLVFRSVSHYFCNDSQLHMIIVILQVDPIISFLIYP